MEIDTKDIPTDKEVLRLTGKRDRLIGCVEKESILGKDISTCLPVSLNLPSTQPHIKSLWIQSLRIYLLGWVLER